VPFDIRERIQADLLVILAHPDDEGVVAPLLAREAAERKKRVAVVYLTDGRNGTNRAGDLRGRPFGIVRLAEVHWTLDRLGVSIFHCLELPDGQGRGDPAQVLRAWGRERTTGSLVRLIRLLRPREILTWFPGPAASHMDHMAAGAAAMLAAKAASDDGAFRAQSSNRGPLLLSGSWRRPRSWGTPRTRTLKLVKGGLFRPGCDRFGWMNTAISCAVSTPTWRARR
jgi:LmbE family N-acetylglucosaminyl deacetylase